ncbi:MAG: protein kinase [Candidatus Riflebacteria bacterium]|nr:protein kinase [Candidatus Riflebacteria bacterium]
MAGESFARYVVKARIRALGLHVTAFRASQPGLEREVELRVLQLASVAGTAEADRFAREFRALASFDHPNLVQVLDIGKTPEHLFYAVSYREARSLEEVFAQGPSTELAVVRAAAALSAGLDYLHTHGYLHRSLSPATLFYDSGLERYYLGDFSTMEPVAPESEASSGLNARLAMTPEARRTLPFDERTDLFLLGATLYRMLTGVDPLPLFAGAPSDQGSPLRSPLDCRPDLSREMDGFLCKVLEPEPAARFQTASEMLAAAQHVQKKLELRSLVDQSGSHATVPAASEPDVAPTASSPRMSRIQRAANPRSELSSSGLSRTALAAAAESRSGPAETLSRSNLRAAEPRPAKATRGPSSTGAALGGSGQLPVGSMASGTIPRSPTASTPARPRWNVRHAGAAARETIRRVSRRMTAIPETSRKPFVIAGAVAVVALFAVLSLRGSGGPSEELDFGHPAAQAVAATAPSALTTQTTGPALVPDDSAEKTLRNVRQAADQARQVPTDLSNFRDRWQALRRWYSSQPAARQADLFPYDRLLQAKLGFASNPEQACKQLDELYEKVSGELK